MLQCSSLHDAGRVLESVTQECHFGYMSRKLDPAYRGVLRRNLPPSRVQTSCPTNCTVVCSSAVPQHPLQLPQSTNEVSSGKAVGEYHLNIISNSMSKDNIIEGSVMFGVNVKG